MNVVWQADARSTTVHAGYSRYFTPPPFELVAGGNIAQFADTTAAAAVTQDDTVQRRARQLLRRRHRPGRCCPACTSASTPTTSRRDDLIDEGQFGAPIILSRRSTTRTARCTASELSRSYDRGPFSLYGNVA